MSGYDIYLQAISLLGYSDYKGDISDGDQFLKRALDAVIYVCNDLKISPPEIITDSLCVNEKQAQALVCGVAMMLSLGDGDMELNQHFTELYNSKRAEAKAQTSAIRDVLPCDDGGVDT